MRSKKNVCTDPFRVKAVIFVSKYMIKKYGLDVAIQKTLNKKNK